MKLKWRRFRLTGRKDFENTGVDVVFLEYTKGVSSTLLADVLHKIQSEGK